MSQKDNKKSRKNLWLWILSIIFIVGGMSTLSNSFFAGVFGFVAGVIICPPITKIIKEKSEGKAKTWMFVTAFIVLVLFSGMALPNTENSQDNNVIENSNTIENQISNQDTTPQKQVQQECIPNWNCDSWSECSKSGIQTRTCTDSNNCGINSGKPKTSQSCSYEYGLGDKVVVDDLAYIVHAKTEEDKIGEYNEYVGFMGEEADGIFYIFDITIENVGKESQTFLGSNIKIYDSQDRTFDHDSTAEFYLDDSFQYDQLQPSLPKKGKIVFDVPKGLSGKLEISGNEFLSENKEYVSWE